MGQKKLNQPQLFIKFIAKILNNNQCNSIFFVILFAIQSLQLFTLTLKQKNGEILQNILCLTGINSKILSFLFLFCTLIFVCTFLAGYRIFTKKNQIKSNQTNFILQTVIIIINHLSVLFRTVLLIPLNLNIWSSLHGDQVKSTLIINILSGFLYFLIIVPIVFSQYFNRIILQKQAISYPHVFNLASFNHFYLHIFVCLKVFLPISLPYISLIYLIVTGYCILINTLISYRKNQLFSISNSIQTATIFTFTIFEILSFDNTSIGGILLTIFVILCSAFLLNNLQDKMITRNYLKKSEKQNILSKLVNHNQLFFYHLINFSQKEKDLILYTFQHSKNFNDKKCFINDVLTNLNSNVDKNTFFNKLKQICQEEMLVNYNNEKMMRLGEKQGQKQLIENPKTYMLITQLIIMDDFSCLKTHNIRKAYYLIKKHSQILQKCRISDSFVTKVELEQLSMIIQSQIYNTCRQNGVNKDTFNLKAYNFFLYQQNFEKFKSEIQKSALNSLEFWQQIKLNEPDMQKTKILIDKAHKISSKVQQMYKKIIKYYPKSSVIIYDLISKYSQLILNSSTFSASNFFTDLNAKYTQQFQIIQKQGSQSVFQQFSELNYTSMCLVNIEEKQIGQISRANNIFWQKYFQGNIHVDKKQTIFSLILPFSRQSHRLHFKNFIFSQDLKFEHNQILVFNPSSQTIQRSSILMQILPNLKEGLQLSMFFMDQGQNKINYSSNLDIIVNKTLDKIYVSLDVHAEWKKQKSQQATTRFIIQTLENNQSLMNIMKASQKCVEAKIQMENSDYLVKLKKKYNAGEQQYFHFEFKNIFQQNFEKIQSQVLNPPQIIQNQTKKSDEFKSILQNTIKTLNYFRKTNKIKNLSILKEPINKQLKTNGQIVLPVEYNQIMQQKSQQLLTIQRIYQTLTRPKTPKKIIIWRIVTIILVLGIMSSIFTNIFITINRQSVYQLNIDRVKNFNELLQYLLRSTITLKDYNYQAYYNSTSQNSISCKNQLQVYTDNIDNRLSQLQSQLSDNWNAFQFQNTGKLIHKQQKSYVVLANYVLSSLTYISQQDPSVMAFPFLESQFLWFLGMTSAQVAFQNSLFNTAFLGVKQMLQKRKQLTKSAQIQILSIFNQQYIYPTIFGTVYLISFMLFSIYIELNSKKIIQQTSKIMSKLNFAYKKNKILKAHQLIHYIKIYQFRDEVQLANKTHMTTLKQNKKSQLKLQNCENSQIENDKQDFSESQDYTQRQLAQNTQMTESQIKSIEMNSPIDQHTGHIFDLMSPQKNMIMLQNEKTISLQIKISKQKTILLYSAVVIPFLAYFLGIFVGGLHLNNTIMLHINIGSQLYHRNSHQQLIYFSTRNTFLYAGHIKQITTTWAEMVLPNLMTAYDTEHYVSDKIEETDKTSHFYTLYKKFQHGNLCDYISMFPQRSIYANVKFTRSECESTAEGVLMAGFKQTLIYFIEKGVEIVSINPTPENMSKVDRLNNLNSTQMNDLKVLLAYCQQFHLLINEAFQQSIQQIKENFLKIVYSTSIVLMLSLVLIIMVINYRWRLIKAENKTVQSILHLVSFKDINYNKILKEEFMNIEYQFYQQNE